MTAFEVAHMHQVYTAASDLVATQEPYFVCIYTTNAVLDVGMNVFNRNN